MKTIIKTTAKATKRGYINRKAVCDKILEEMLACHPFRILKSKVVGTTYYAAIMNYRPFDTVKVGDIVYCYDELSHDFTEHAIRVESVESEEGYRVAYGDDLSFPEEDGCDNYITRVTEGNFIGFERNPVFAVVIATAIDSKMEDNFHCYILSENDGPHQCECPESILDLLSETDDEFAQEWRANCRDNINRKIANPPLNRLGIGSIVEFQMDDQTYRAERVEVNPSPLCPCKTSSAWCIVGTSIKVTSQCISKRGYKVIKVATPEDRIRRNKRNGK